MNFKNLLFTSLILIGAQLFAQEEEQKEKRTTEVNTVFASNGSFGGFLSFDSKVGDINGQSSLMVGGKLSAVFSSQMNIGIVGYGLVTDLDANTYDEDDQLFKVEMGYGGLLLEPVIANSKLIHLTTPLILGVGGIGLRRDNWEKINDDNSLEENYHDDIDTFLVFEPGLNAELNLFRNVRLNLGASYRYVYDSNIDGISDGQLSGFAANIGLKLGWF